MLSREKMEMAIAA